MSKYFLFLQTVHDTVHDSVFLSSKKRMIESKFSEPKIFTGGVDIYNWKSLSEKEKKAALAKEWYVYYSFRDPETKKLKRMPNIKAGVNRMKTMRERLRHLRTISDALLLLLEQGLNPYEDNDLTQITTTPKTVATLTEDSVAIHCNPIATTKLVTKPINKENNIILEVEKTLVATASTNQVATTSTSTKPTKKEKEVIIEDKKTTVETPIVKEVATTVSTSIKDAFDFALKMKKGVLSLNSYKNFELRIRKYRKTLNEEDAIESITKKSVNDFLNDVLVKTSARTRNNTRVDLSGLFQVLEDNEIIPLNFIKSISLLKTNPERNKTYTPDMQANIFNYLEEKDPLLLLYIKFVSFNFLRPIEVSRLKVKDIDLKDRKLYIKAKNKAVKIKIIPEILIDDLPDFSKLDPENYLFTPTGLGLEWVATENNRRDSFTKRFKEVVKDHFKLGLDYGMYSFRHTFITKLYRKIREENSQFEAKSILMGITGHTTMSALEKYLRDIDAELPEDYSNLLR